MLHRHNALQIFLLLHYVFGAEKVDKPIDDGPYHDQLMQRKFEEFGLVPKIFRESPEHYLYSKYSEDIVRYGTILHPKKIFKELPEIWYDLLGTHELYLLLLLDVDHPSRSEPSKRSLLLWMLANMKGHDITTGTNITDPIDPFPVANTGLHRYVLVVYGQENEMHLNEYKNLTFAQRESFNVTLFEDKYLFGRPYAGNFFQAELVKKPGG